MRKSTRIRKTTETDIALSITLDGNGNCNSDTGIGFMDHMFTLFAKHGSIDVELTCKGDLWVDHHHTLEDLGIVMGEAVMEALGDKSGIHRYGTFYCPMDEALSRVCIDLSGRGYLVYDVVLKRDTAGSLETDAIKEFFYAFAIHGGLNLHITNLYGDNTHHILESIFKATARALKEACTMDNSITGIPSTKGIL
ncbi:MAG: imidazoleglycerol-phosphate dehydratase HisB [Eubacteriales bacterium]